MTQGPAFESDGRVYPELLSQRYDLGPLRRGWSHNWQPSQNIGRLSSRAPTYLRE